MKSRKIIVLLTATCALPVAMGTAADQTKVAPAHPADAKAAVPPLIYDSSFRDYKPFGETPIAPWKPANELTEKIGGWRAYLKESRQPDAAEPAITKEKPGATQTPAQNLAPPQPDPHSGHKH
ncbi:MAG: hypothetical protein WCB36_12845 [Burkholderiales bacterium]